MSILYNLSFSLILVKLLMRQREYNMKLFMVWCFIGLNNVEIVC